MGAVANNPEFAAEVGVPRSVGAEFMVKGKNKVRKYQRGDMVEGDRTAAMLGRGIGSIGAVEGATDAALGARSARPRPLGFTAEEIKPRKKRKKKKKSTSYYHGGKVRGCGKETQGRRKAKMVRMKGS
jgi:hypothetical protein